MLVTQLLSTYVYTMLVTPTIDNLCLNHTGYPNYYQPMFIPYWLPQLLTTYV